MADWRDQILKEFTPQVARLTLVADPDGLLLEEGILQGIRERGFELIPFEDPVAFRFAYESKFRSRWDRGEHTDLVVVLRSGSGSLDTLPFDLLEAGRRLSFSIGDIFPNLSYPVVAALERSDFDALYKAQTLYAPGNLGDNATREFVLRHVFELAPEMIKQPSDLLRVLLRRHYRSFSIPAILDERLIEILRKNDLFEEWPLEKIIPDRAAFLAFLQERWPLFLDKVAAREIGELKEKAVYGLQYAGPYDIPFDHDDIRIYIDNLFLEDLLHAVSHEKSEILDGKWVSVGIRRDPEADRLQRLERLIQTVKDTIPTPDARHQEWLHFAYRWAEIIVLLMEEGAVLPAELGRKVEEIRCEVDQAFMSWIERRYPGLHNQPPLPPVMLHHIPSTLARYMGESKVRKIAFLLIDGLSIDQWVVMRHVLQEQRPDIRFNENAVFAWMPTVTSVSRQAAFAGKTPLYFPASIKNTEKEEAHWSQFWLDQRLTRQEIAYARGLGDGCLSAVEEILSDPRVRVAGLVIDKVDRIMHGMELGTAGMHNQIRQWTSQGFMAKLFDLFMEHGFHIFLSSDHGNIEARGCGSPSEGVIAEFRGSRVRIYPDRSLRSRIKERFRDAIEWEAIGLPEDFLPLLAPDRMAFVREGEKIVGHGGLSIEELIVPLIHIRPHITPRDTKGRG